MTGLVLGLQLKAWLLNKEWLQGPAIHPYTRHPPKISASGHQPELLHFRNIY